MPACQYASIPSRLLLCQALLLGSVHSHETEAMPSESTLVGSGRCVCHAASSNFTFECWLCVSACCRLLLLLLLLLLQVEKMVAAAEADGDGEVSWREFVSALPDILGVQA